MSSQSPTRLRTGFLLYGFIYKDSIVPHMPEVSPAERRSAWLRNFHLVHGYLPWVNRRRQSKENRFSILSDSIRILFLVRCHRNPRPDQDPLDDLRSPDIKDGLFAFSYSLMRFSGNPDFKDGWGITGPWPWRRKLINAEPCSLFY